MVRGNGSARAETSVKAATRPNTIRITMRRGPLRDQPRRYKGPVDGTAVLGTPTPATALPPTAARTTSVSRDSLPEPSACLEECPAPGHHRTDFGDRGGTRVSAPSGEHVLRLHRWRLISPARTLVTEDGRHFGVGELIGKRGHGGRVGHAADGLARQAT